MIWMFKRNFTTRTKQFEAFFVANNPNSSDPSHVDAENANGTKSTTTAFSILYFVYLYSWWFFEYYKNWQIRIENPRTHQKLNFLTKISHNLALWQRNSVNCLLLLLLLLLFFIIDKAPSYTHTCTVFDRKFTLLLSFLITLLDLLSQILLDYTSTAQLAAVFNIVCLSVRHNLGLLDCLMYYGWIHTTHQHSIASAPFAGICCDFRLIAECVRDRETKRKIASEKES